MGIYKELQSPKIILLTDYQDLLKELELEHHTVADRTGLSKTEMSYHFELENIVGDA